MLLLSMVDVNGSVLHISKNSKQAFFSYKVDQNPVIKAAHVKLSVSYVLLFFNNCGHTYHFGCSICIILNLQNVH